MFFSVGHHIGVLRLPSSLTVPSLGRRRCFFSSCPRCAKHRGLAARSSRATSACFFAALGQLAPAGRTPCSPCDAAELRFLPLASRASGSPQCSGNLLFLSVTHVVDREQRSWRGAPSSIVVWQLLLLLLTVELPVGRRRGRALADDAVHRGRARKFILTPLASSFIALLLVDQSSS